MDYLYLTPELQASILAERRREFEIWHFRSTVDVKLLTERIKNEKDEAEKVLLEKEVEAISEKQGKIEEDVSALDTIISESPEAIKE